MSHLTPGSSGEAVEARLAGLRKQYGLALPDKITGIEAAVAAIVAGAWQEPTCSTAYRQVHTLAGSSGTYGFPEICGVARAAESILRTSLESRSALAAADRAHIDELLAKLREMAADAARQASG